ncbi:MAG TPA: arginine--tRNA ligase [Thermoplasmata archaeon]|nr:arginine--tRNA ligase [Thermoplasmata archaeon]
MGHDPWSDLRDQAETIRRSIESSLSVTTAGILEEAPEDRGFFALATHAWAKELKSKPADIASRAARVRVAAPFSPLKAEGPYVNFRVEPSAFADLVLGSVRSQGERYGASPPRKERVLLEHTSTNPTGPIHVGRARNPFLGDALVRILRLAGYPVQSEYLVNDIGRQMVLLYWAVRNLPMDSVAAEPRIEYRYVALYQKASAKLETDDALKREIERLTQRFEGGDVQLTKDIRKVGEDILRGILETLRRANVTFDSFFWESDSILDGSVQRVIARLMPQSREEDGARYIDLTAFGLEGDAAKYVFVRRDGTSLYTTRDIAYHLNKKERCDVAIDVLGEDHKLTFQRLKAAFQLMGIDWAPETIFYAFVTLPEGRMSTRKGLVVYLDDLLEEALDRAYAEVAKRREDLSEERKRAIAETIGIGAVRYNIVRVQAEKAILFRWEDALNFEGNSAPFLQYAHARACSILAKVKGRGPGEFDRLTHPQEQRLLRWIAKFPSTIRDAAAGHRVHVVASFAADFAAQFNQFYRDCPVLTADPMGLRNARIALVDGSRVVLRNALDCLGLKAPNEM